MPGEIRRASLVLTERMSLLLHFLEMNTLAVYTPKSVNDRYLGMASMLSFKQFSRTQTEEVGAVFFSSEEKTFPPPGAVGSAECVPECGRQTGFHTALLGRAEPLVNSPVVKAEQ